MSPLALADNCGNDFIVGQLILRRPILRSPQRLQEFQLTQSNQLWKQQQQQHHRNQTNLRLNTSHKPQSSSPTAAKPASLASCWPPTTSLATPVRAPKSTWRSTTSAFQAIGPCRAQRPPWSHQVSLHSKQTTVVIVVVVVSPPSKSNCRPEQLAWRPLTPSDWKLNLNSNCKSWLTSAPRTINVRLFHLNCFDVVVVVIMAVIVAVLPSLGCYMNRPKEQFARL